MGALQRAEPDDDVEACRRLWWNVVYCAANDSCVDAGGCECGCQRRAIECARRFFLDGRSDAVAESLGASAADLRMRAAMHMTRLYLRLVTGAVERYATSGKWGCFARAMRRADKHLWWMDHWGFNGV